MSKSGTMLQDIHRKLSPVFTYVRAFGALAAFLAFIFAYVIDPLSSDLTTRYTLMPYLLNTTILEDQASRSQDDAIGQPELHLLQIVIRNKTYQEIDNLEVTVHGIREVRHVGVRSSSERLQSVAASISEITELEGHRILLSGLVSIPPRAQVTVQIVGSMYTGLFLPRTEVGASVAQIRVTETTELSGILVILSQHAAMLTAILILIFVYFGVRNLERNRKETT